MSSSNYLGLSLLCVTLLLSLPAHGNGYSYPIFPDQDAVFPACCPSSSMAFIQKPIKACAVQRPEMFISCPIRAIILTTTSDEMFCVTPGAKWLRRKLWNELAVSGLSRCVYILRPSSCAAASADETHTLCLCCLFLLRNVFILFHVSPERDQTRNQNVLHIFHLPSDASSPRTTSVLHGHTQNSQTAISLLLFQCFGETLQRSSQVLLQAKRNYLSSLQSGRIHIDHIQQ